MNKKKSDFDKVFSAWDILVIAFGAMIGWGWVVSTGGWIEKGGVVGAALGFAIGGVMIFLDVYKRQRAIHVQKKIIRKLSDRES